MLQKIDLTFKSFLSTIESSEKYENYALELKSIYDSLTEIDS
jgi:hypothetical protein